MNICENKVVWLVLLVLVGCTMMGSEGKISSCSDVIQMVSPCLDYARNGGKHVPHQCCSTLKKLSDAADSTKDKQQVCKCAQNFAPLIPGLDFKRINKIPKKCGVHLSLKISPHIDCSKVK